jgi:hypothetical protein
MAHQRGGPEAAEGHLGRAGFQARVCAARPYLKAQVELVYFSPSRTTIPDMHSKRLEVCYSNINVHFHDDSRNEVSLLPRRTSSHRR